jgi:phage terminase small subunit
MGESKPKKKPLTQKQKKFCREYIYDWNATRSYKEAYKGVKNDNVAKAAASRLLTNVNVQSYIVDIQKDLEKLAGISRMKVISEHMKMAFSSIAHLHNTWIQRKDFESLTDEQKDCIAEIDTKVRIEYEYDPDNPKEKKPVTVEYVKIKLYDKQKALDSISKMLGYDAPIKTELTGKDGKDLIPIKGITFDPE